MNLELLTDGASEWLVNWLIADSAQCMGAYGGFAASGIKLDHPCVFASRGTMVARCCLSVDRKRRATTLTRRRGTGDAALSLADLRDGSAAGSCDTPGLAGWQGSCAGQRPLGRSSCWGLEA